MSNRRPTDTEMAVTVGFALACGAGSDGRRAPRVSRGSRQAGYNKPYPYRSFAGVRAAKDLVRAVLFVLLPVGVALMAPLASHAQTVSFAGAQSTVSAGGLYKPLGVAVDGAGDVFMAGSFNNRIVEVSPDGQSTVTGLSFQPWGIATDRAGDLFIVDLYDNQVVEIPAGCTSASCQTTVPATGLAQPAGCGRGWGRQCLHRGHR